MHSTQIKKWGNSLAVRIPKHLADEIELQKDMPIELEIEQGELHIKPKRESEYTLDELVGDITEENKHTEVDFGEKRGREIW